MTSRRAIKTLERRRDYLRARVAVKRSRSGGSDEDSGYDLAEIAALELALAAFEDAERIGLPRLGRLTVLERQRLRAVLEAKSRAA